VAFIKMVANGVELGSAMAETLEKTLRNPKKKKSAQHFGYQASRAYGLRQFGIFFFT
jgi:hypothetical protein